MKIYNFAAAALAVAGCASDSTNLCAPGFATSVIAVNYGEGATYGQDKLPNVVLGPPHGGGDYNGSLDVLSLGAGGSVTLGFAYEGIADEPGADFIVFENAFYVGADKTKPYAELGEVSVSEDGETFKPFPCQSQTFPFTGCAGWHATFANPDKNTISPFDPNTAGGDSYDLADLGMAQAKYIRIHDLAAEGGGPSVGFDLDAIAITHPKCNP